jgi:hypothetical protein
MGIVNVYLKLAPRSMERFPSKWEIDSIFALTVG